MGEEDPIDKAKRLLKDYYNENYILKPTDYLNPMDFKVVNHDNVLTNSKTLLISPYYHLDETMFEATYDAQNSVMYINAYKKVTGVSISHV